MYLGLLELTVYNFNNNWSATLSFCRKIVYCHMQSFNPVFIAPKVGNMNEANVY